MNSLNKIIGVFLLVATTYSSAQSEIGNYDLFGAQFQLQTDLQNQGLLKNIAANDTIKAQLKGNVLEVCQAKGCWMKVKLDNGEQVFVRFKDYGFFVPTDSAKKTAIINGVAFVEQMSVKDQHHYARDKGVSEDEINKITEPKRTLRFEADGVLIRK